MARNCQAAQDKQKEAFHFKVVEPDRARRNQRSKNRRQKDAVRLLLGQFVKSDISLIVDVIHSSDFSFVFFSEVDQFQNRCIQRYDDRNVQKNISVEKCGHEDDAEEWTTDQEYDKWHDENRHSECWIKI